MGCVGEGTSVGCVGEGRRVGCVGEGTRDMSQCHVDTLPCPGGCG